MSNQVIAKILHISKTYKLYDKPLDRVKESLHPFHKIYHKEFHALKDVSFEIKKGEALGIIGRNGNGKSTLLKIIAGVLTPTKGNINTKGKISAILELTSNLKPELTGLENIALNLKISGFKGKKLKEKTEEIKEFADLDEFISQPIKTYSSGMKSRLGFGIATSIEPDILILDEVLAVGDFVFQQKCLSKINAMRDKISMIFVSHSMNSVRLFCDNVLVLDRGKKAFYGKADDGIKYYLEQEEKKKQELKKKEIKINDTPFYWKIIEPTEKIHSITHYWLVNNKKGTTSRTGDKLSIIVKFTLNYKPKNLVVGIPIWNKDGDFITGISTDMDKIKLISADNKYEIKLTFDNILNPNIYVSAVAIHDGLEYLYRQLNKNLNVNNRNRYFGFVTLKHDWNL